VITTHLNSSAHGATAGTQALTASGPEARYSRKAIDKAGKTGKVELTLDTSSIDTGTAAFDKHLQGDSFFNAAIFPTAKFVANNFSFSGDKVNEVTGQLTMLGKTVPVVLKATNFNCYVNPMLKREVCGGDFETTIQRSQWGM